MDFSCDKTLALLHVYFFFISRFALGLFTVCFYFSIIFTPFINFFFNISAAIKSALKQENLNPEIEEKLLQLQRYQEKQMKQEPDLPSPVPKVNPTVVPNSRFPVVSRKRPPSASKNDDSDWVMDTPKRSRPNRNTEVKNIETDSQ